jgi:hypothetical protein
MQRGQECRVELGKVTRGAMLLRIADAMVLDRIHAEAMGDGRMRASQMTSNLNTSVLMIRSAS